MSSPFRGAATAIRIEALAQASWLLLERSDQSSDAGLRSQISITVIRARAEIIFTNQQDETVKRVLPELFWECPQIKHED